MLQLQVLNAYVAFYPQYLTRAHTYFTGAIGTFLKTEKYPWEFSNHCKDPMNDSVSIKYMWR